MKHKKLFASVLTIIIISSLSKVYPQNNPNMKNGFYLGPMSHFFESTLQNETHSQWYKDLHFNMMQSYNAHLDNIDPHFQGKGQKDGGFFEDISNYQAEMTQTIANWNKIAQDNSLLFEREKIIRPAYGKRFTFHAEGSGTWKNRFPSYGFESSETGSDYSENWMNEIVNGRECIKGKHQSGFIVSNLYENTGQINVMKIVDDNTNSNGWDRLYSNVKLPKYNMRWFVKPRMRMTLIRKSKTRMSLLL